MANAPLSPPDAARRRYLLRQGVIMLLFAGSIIASSLHQLMVVLPILLLALWSWEFFKSIRDDDEMMRAFALRAISFSAVSVLLIATMWGLLEVFAGAPHLPSYLLLPAFATSYGISSVVMGKP